jgi:hypothetical protein
MDEPVDQTPFKPSQVDFFGSFPPLVDTFEKTECEVAAVYLVSTMAATGDAWRPVTWSDCAVVITSALKSVEEKGYKNVGPGDRLIEDLAKNPYCKPDFHKLAKLGYARWLGEPGGKTPLELTEAGIEKLRRWVRVKEI